MLERGPGNNISTVTEEDQVVPVEGRDIMKGREIIILLKRSHSARQFGLCNKVTRERMWLINVSKYSTSEGGKVKYSGRPTTDMCRGVDSALCLLCIPAASFVLGIGDQVYDKHEVTSEWRVPRGQAAKQGNAEEKIRARASASQKRGPVEEQDADDHHDDGGDEEEEVEEDEEAEDEEDEEADSEVQEVKVVKHKDKEKVSSPAVQKTRFKRAVFVKEDSSPLKRRQARPGRRHHVEEIPVQQR